MFEKKREWSEAEIDRFSKILSGVFGLHLKTASDEVIEIYYRALQKYDFGDVKTAFDRHVSNPDAGKFLPKPADIIQIIEGDSGQRALRAWVIAREAISGYGPYKSVIFDDEFIHAVIHAMGGWIKFCNDVSDKTAPFLKRDFLDFYKTFLAYQSSVYFPEKLIGLSEQENYNKGLTQFIPKVFYVGHEINANKLVEGKFLK